MIRRHLMAAIFSAVALPAAAHAGPQLGVIVQWGGRQAVNVAYNEGYARGVRAGEEDARRGNRFAFNDERDYRDADQGYRREYGSRDAYRLEYQRGFEVGYELGYRRVAPGRERYDDRGRYDGRGGYGGPGGSARGRYDIAAQQGYNDGYEAGFDDGRDRRRFDPIGESRYRSGDRGYKSSYGSRDLYKANYRDAFRSGYEDGYADATRYRR